MNFDNTQLDKLLRQLRKIEEHRSVAAEKQIRKTYKQILAELKLFLSDAYINYSIDDRLTFAALQQHGYYARFIEEVEEKLSGISPQISNEITKTVEEAYQAMYDGSIQAVKKAAGSNLLLHQFLDGVQGTAPEVVRSAVENNIFDDPRKLILKDTLEKNRKDIIYNIKREVNTGLLNGDRYSTVAKRISKSLDGDYKKSIRIARTESHRVIEAGHNDANVAMDEKLKGSGYRLIKIWHTMQDERVRPKRGRGKKPSGAYNHVILDNVKAPMDYYFNSEGTKAMAPSQSGEAGFDINCRCQLSTKLVSDKELEEIKRTYSEHISKP